MTPQEQTQLQRYANLLYGSGYGNNGRTNMNGSVYNMAPQQMPPAMVTPPPTQQSMAPIPIPPPRPRQYSVGVGPVTATPTSANVGPMAFAPTAPTSGTIPPGFMTSANAANYPMPMSQSMVGRTPTTSSLDIPPQMGPESSETPLTVAFQNYPELRNLNYGGGNNSSMPNTNDLYNSIMQSYMQHPGT